MHICFMLENQYFICGLLFLSTDLGGSCPWGNCPGGGGGGCPGDNCPDTLACSVNIS